MRNDIEKKLNTSLPKEALLLTADSIKLPPRSDKSNKGTYGKVCVIGGSRGMAGAICLAAEAAARSGAGLVKAVTSGDGVAALNRRLPEVMTCNALDHDGLNGLYEAALWADSVLVGPGLGRDGQAVRVLKTVLECFMAKGEKEAGPHPAVNPAGKRKRLVLDADALFLLGLDKGLFETLPEQTVLTPHMGELAHLSGFSISELKSGIFDIANQLTYNNNLIYVCKDACTIVAENGKTAANTSGNNGMSTGGCGDVLAGLIAGLLASGETPFDAACAGVFIHGLAGDIAAERLSSYCVTATSVLKDLPEAFRSVLRSQKRDMHGNSL